MKDNWDELFDHLKEEDILGNLPEDLPEREDELAAKRIENRVQEEIKTDMDRQKKQSRKRILAAVVCCIVAVGAFGHKPILAAFQRLFYDLPGVGIYIDEENKTIYEVQIDEPVREKDGVQVELKNFYCADRVIYGEIRITGENVGLLSDGSWISRKDKEYSDLLEDKFKVTLYVGEEKRECHPNGTGTNSDDNGKIERFDMEFKSGFYLKEGIDTCYLEVAGVNERFTLKIAESKVTENPEELGYSVTKNDTTITARAVLTDEGIELEYFVIPSDEQRLAMESWRRFYVGQAPYQFDMENIPFVSTVNGEKIKLGRGEEMQSGRKFLLDGTKADFPLTLHYPPLTGMNEESHTIELSLPKEGETLTENLPKLDFQYGTVEILSITKEKGKYDDGDMEHPKVLPATRVELIYRVTPKEGTRQMYTVHLDAAEDWYAMGGIDTGDEDFVYGEEIYLSDLEIETLTVTFDKAAYWIEGAYDIVIEKPMEKK